MPTVGEVHVDSVLSNISIAWQNDEMIADKVLPVVKVKKETDIYFKYDKEAFRPTESYRRPGTVANEVDSGLSQDTYSAEEYALRKAVHKRVVDNSDDPLSPMIDTTEMLTGKIEIDKEIRAKNLVCNYAAYAATHKATLDVNTQWSAYASATSLPLTNIRNAKRAVHKDTFKRPNKMFITYPAAEFLAAHPTIVDLQKYTHPDLLTDSGLPKVLQGLEVVITGAGYNKAEKGLADDLDYIWERYTLIAYVNPRPGIKSLTLGVQFQPRGRQTKRWWIEDRDSTMIEVSEIVAEKMVAIDCGYLIKDTIAA